MLTKVVGVGGRKGGTGKTTISHVIATGLAHLARAGEYEDLTQETIISLLVTDPDSEVPSAEGRVYECLDGRNSKEADRIILALTKAPDPIAMVIDSAARQVDLDTRLVAGADIFLLPVTSDDDAAIKAGHDLIYYKSTRGVEAEKIWIVPNIWPPNPAIRSEVERKLFEGLASWDGGKGWKNVMAPIFSRPALNRLTRLDDADSRRDQVRFCMEFTRDVLKVAAGTYEPYAGFSGE